MNQKIKLNLVFTLLILAPVASFAQDNSENLITPEMSIYLVVALVFALAVIILGVSYNVYHIIKTIVSNEAERKAKEAGTEYIPEASWWTKMINSWTKATPLEEEPSITLDHDYDGIRELDNHLPPWWLALFYGTIVIGVIYLFGYHVMGWWPLQEQEYEIAMARAQEILAKQSEGEDAIDENTIEYNSDPVFLSGGKAVYDQSCATCHRLDGGGLVGPNLTDNYWLHGGSAPDIYKIIKNGIAAKGMASWEKALPPQKIAQVTSYIISLNGTNPPDPKAPQGDLAEPAGDEVDVESNSDINQETSEGEGDGDEQQTEG